MCSRASKELFNLDSFLSPSCICARNDHGSLFLNTYYVPSPVPRILHVTSLMFTIPRETGIMGPVHRQSRGPERLLLLPKVTR